MKTVRLENNIVAEIIPKYALPVAKWYGAEFAAQCVEAPDKVEQRWVYDPDNGTFSEPSEPEEPAEPEAEPTVWDELDAAYQEGVNTAYDQ